MRKVYYFFRNALFPKKHDEIIVKYIHEKERLKLLQIELDRINKLASHGILGDRLLDKQIMLEQNVRVIKNNILLLKWRYQNKLWKGE